MQSFENALYKFLSYACAFLILAMTLLIFWQVVARYVMNDSLTWSEEIGRYMFVWITFVGLPAALKAGAHVAIDLLLKKTHGAFHMTILTVNAIATCFIGIVIGYSGIRLTVLGVGQISSALQIPMQYVYAIIPLSGLCLAFFAVTDYFHERSRLLKGDL